MGDKMDLKASGSISVAGGEYGEVKTSASLKVNGNLKCDNLSCSGSAKVAGDLECAGKVACSGSLAVDGAIQTTDASISGSFSVGGSVTVAGLLRVSGSVKTGQDLTAKEAKISGSCRLGGQLKGGELKISGSLRAQGVEAERFLSSGVLDVEGLVTAEEMELRVNGTSKAGDLGGSTIRVLDGATNGSGITVFGVQIISIGVRHGFLTAGSIEGDEVELECTTAQVVRGRNVRIGRNCNIDRVEYTDSLTVDEYAEVKEQVRV